MNKVSIVRCDSYDKVEKAIRESIDLIGGISKFVKKGDVVLLKPNMLQSDSQDGPITTHPNILRAVIKIVKERGATPYIGDSPAFESQKKAYESCGFKQVADETDTDLLYFKGEKKSFPNGIVSKAFNLPANIDDFDVIINLPKIKTHMLTDYTGAVKNLFGLIVGKIKSTYHMRFADKKLFTQMLIDLYNLVKPQLNIMDGVVSMEGEGPFAGTPRKTDLILASDDALALDLIVTAIIGMENTPFNQIASERKLAEHTQLLGLDLEKAKVKGFKQPKGYIKRKLTLRRKIMRKLLVLNPHVIKNKCTACKRCYNICPSEPKTISMSRKYKDKLIPHFDYENCIHCYCCHEVCPEKAIKLKRDLF